MKIDANNLLKSIASTGAVYVRLYVDEFDDNSQFDMSPFELQAVDATTNPNSTVDQGGQVPITGHAVAQQVSQSESYTNPFEGLQEVGHASTIPNPAVDQGDHAQPTGRGAEQEVIDITAVEDLQEISAITDEVIKPYSKSSWNLKNAFKIKF